MIWKDLLTILDIIRVNVRTTDAFVKSPRATIPATNPIVADVEKLLAGLKAEVGAPVITIELDAAGHPILTDDLKALFATVPSDFVPPPAPNEGARIIRRNPVMGKDSTGEKAEPRAVMLPRETIRIEHAVSLEDATEDTVAK